MKMPSLLKLKLAQSSAQTEHDELIFCSSLNTVKGSGSSGSVKSAPSRPKTTFGA